MGATAALMGVQVLGGVMQGQAIRSEGAYAEKMARINARRAEDIADQVVKKGDEDAAKYGKQVKALTGSQKAMMAAQGIDLGFGTPTEIIAQTEIQGAEDVNKIKSNAFREAMGYKVQAQDEIQKGIYAKKSADFRADMSILGGGLSAAQSYQYNKGF